MPTIVIATDFSDNSRNAARYACEMVYGNADKFKLDFLLLHVYHVPATFTTEVAGDALSDSLLFAEEKIADELDWIKTNYPNLKITSKVNSGFLRKSLEQECSLSNAAVLVIGASGNYDDIWSWNSEILGLLRRMKVPVLLVPSHVAYKPIKNIAYACNYKNVTDNTPFDSIKSITQLLGGQLDVVYVQTPERPNNSAGENGQRLIKEQLKEVNPTYHTLENTNIVEALEQYILAQHADLLLLVPHRYGIWENAFHQSKTYGMARLNRLPVLALREK